MKAKIFPAIACLLVIVASVYLIGQGKSGGDKPKTTAKTAFRTKVNLTPGDSVLASQFAWSLFVDAVTPYNNSLYFESLTEQCQLNPNMAFCPSSSSQASARGKRRFLHGSPLLRRNLSAVGENTQPDDECGAMNTNKSFAPFVPSNLSSTPIFCEEVFVDASEAAFVTGNGLTTLNGQQAHGNITFPWDAVEIKADWVPASSFSNPTFQGCPDSTHKLYTEIINNTCYALVGVHISSKALPNWVWATFEPNSPITNPNRCNPGLYSMCFDPWGTNFSTPYGPGQIPMVQQSGPLHDLMANLDPAFNNYFLTAVQTQFVDSQNNPIPLGNSFVEFNAQVPPGQASCITCHNYAYYNGVAVPSGKPEKNFGGPLPGWNSVGYACPSTTQNPAQSCLPQSPSWTSQDFSWMLGLMPQSNQSSASAKSGKSRRK